jgi:hypothetical protein
MPVDLQVTLRVDLQIEMSMTANLREHVIEKRDSRSDCMFSRPIEIETHPDIRFVGFS